MTKQLRSTAIIAGSQIATAWFLVVISSTLVIHTTLIGLANAASIGLLLSSDTLPVSEREQQRDGRQPPAAAAGGDGHQLWLEMSDAGADRNHTAETVRNRRRLSLIRRPDSKRPRQTFVPIWSFDDPSSSGDNGARPPRRHYDQPMRHPFSRQLSPALLYGGGQHLLPHLEAIITTLMPPYHHPPFQPAQSHFHHVTSPSSSQPSRPQSTAVPPNRLTKQSTGQPDRHQQKHQPPPSAAVAPAAVAPAVSGADQSRSESGPVTDRYTVEISHSDRRQYTAPLPLLNYANLVLTEDSEQEQETEQETEQERGGITHSAQERLSAEPNGQRHYASRDSDQTEATAPLAALNARQSHSLSDAPHRHQQPQQQLDHPPDTEYDYYNYPDDQFYYYYYDDPSGAPHAAAERTTHRHTLHEDDRDDTQSRRASPHQVKTAATAVLHNTGSNGRHSPPASVSQSSVSTTTTTTTTASTTTTTPSLILFSNFPQFTRSQDQSAGGASTSRSSVQPPPHPHPHLHADRQHTATVPSTERAITVPVRHSTTPASNNDEKKTIDSSKQRHQATHAEHHMPETNNIRMTISDIERIIQPYSLEEVLTDIGIGLEDLANKNYTKDQMSVFLQQMAADKAANRQNDKSASQLVNEQRTGVTSAANTRNDKSLAPKTTAATTDRAATASTTARQSSDSYETSRNKLSNTTTETHTTRKSHILDSTQPDSEGNPTNSSVDTEASNVTRDIVIVDEKKEDRRREDNRESQTKHHKTAAAKRKIKQHKNINLIEILNEKGLTLQEYLAKGGNVKKLIDEYRREQDSAEDDGVEHDNNDINIADDIITTTQAALQKIYSLAEILREKKMTLKQFIKAGFDVEKTLEEYNGEGWRLRQSGMTSTSAPSVDRGQSSDSQTPKAPSDRLNSDSLTNVTDSSGHPLIDASATESTATTTTSAVTTTAKVALTSTPATLPTLKALLGEGQPPAAAGGGRRNRFGTRINYADSTKSDTRNLHQHRLVHSRIGSGSDSDGDQQDTQRPLRAQVRYTANEQLQETGYRYQGDRFDTTAPADTDQLFDTISRETDSLWNHSHSDSHSDSDSDSGSDGDGQARQSDSAIVNSAIASGVVGGCALCFFVGVLVICRWHQQAGKAAPAAAAAAAAGAPMRIGWSGGGGASDGSEAGSEWTDSGSSTPVAVARLAGGYARPHSRHRSSGFWGSLRKLHQRAVYSRSPYGAAAVHC